MICSYTLFEDLFIELGDDGTGSDPANVRFQDWLPPDRWVTALNPPPKESKPIIMEHGWKIRWMHTKLEVIERTFPTHMPFRPCHRGIVLSACCFSAVALCLVKKCQTRLGFLFGRNSRSWWAGTSSLTDCPSRIFWLSKVTILIIRLTVESILGKQTCY